MLSSKRGNSLCSLPVEFPWKRALGTASHAGSRSGASTEHAADGGTTGTRQGLRLNAVAKREHTSTGHSSYKAGEIRSTAGRITGRGKPSAGCGWDAANLPGRQRELPYPWAVLNGLGYLQWPIPAAQSSKKHTNPSAPLLLALQAPSREQGKAGNVWPRITSPTLN